MTRRQWDLVLESIAFIKKGEHLAMALNPKFGYWLAFSGGKDSQALLELVKMANIRYKAFYNVTTNDPPDNVYFIRNCYPEVEFIHPKVNFFKLVEKNGLPMITRRYCCRVLKETSAPGMVVLTGVRSDESRRRAGYTQTMVRSRRLEHVNYSGERTLDDIIASEHRCIKGKDSVMLYPLLKWTESDVWDFLRQRNVPKNPVYDYAPRVGCMFCPYSTLATKEFYEQKYPKFKEHILNSLEVYMSKRQPFREYKCNSPEEVYNAWKQKRHCSTSGTDKNPQDL